MKTSLCLIVILLFCFYVAETKAQGNTAPDWTFTDLNGNSHNLYTYLNQGKNVILDISTTWCGPCWTYHTSNKLESFYNQYGPPGTNQAMVFFIEPDEDTSDDCLYGNTGSCNVPSHNPGTHGDWVTGTPYPIINISPASAAVKYRNDNGIGVYPTMTLICSRDKMKYGLGQYTASQIYNAMTQSCPTPLPSVANDAGIFAILSPNGTSCGSTTNLVVKLRNFGTNALTSCDIHYKVDNNPVQTYNWTGTIASDQSANVSLSSMTTAAGSHTVTCYTSNPNNSTDGNAYNDQVIASFNATSTSQSLPLAEGMENTIFPPAGWSRSNPDNSVSWSRSTTVSKSGSASMFMNNFNYSPFYGSQQTDDIMLPPVDLSSVSNPSLTFQVAYQLRKDPAGSNFFTDTMKVFISTDCGVTWTNVYKKYGTALATTTPVFSPNYFIPTSSQWRQETISLSPYASSANALIKFRNISQLQNTLYVDDINIAGAVGINDISMDPYISVFPNPSAGQVFVNISAPDGYLPVRQAGREDLRHVGVKIYNVLGELVSEINDNIPDSRQLKSDSYRIDLSKQPNGMYFVEVKTDNASIFQKVMLVK